MLNKEENKSGSQNYSKAIAVKYQLIYRYNFVMTIRPYLGRDCEKLPGRYYWKEASKPYLNA